MKKIKIFCDGSCKGNPGPGGWAGILQYKNFIKTISGYSPHTTNNEMELTAVVKALAEVKQKCNIDVYCDSIYVINGMNVWIKNWKKRNWKRGKNRPIKNLSLWKKLDELNQKHNIKWIWIKAHNNHLENEKCDKIAKMEIKKHNRNL